MSGQPNIYAMDQAKFRQQYLSNLNLQANIDDKNLQANKIYKKTGATPTQLTDTRTTAEKLLDIERLKIDVRSGLSQIADGTNANQIVEELDPATLQFLAQHIEEIVKEIKPKYKYGVPADIFIPFITSYMDKAIQTNEVAFGLQQAAGQNIILGIQQIQNQMISQLDLGALRADIANDVFGINAPLQQALIRDIDTLRRLIPTREELVQIAQVQDANTRQSIAIALSNALQVLPTKAEIAPLMRSLEVSLSYQDRRSIENILERLQQILAIEPATSVQLQEVKQLIQETTGQLQAQTAGLKEISEILEPKKISNLYTPAIIQDLQDIYRPSDALATKESLIEYINEMKDKIPSSDKPTNLELGVPNITMAKVEALRQAVIRLNEFISPKIYPGGIPADKLGEANAQGFGISHKIKGKGISKGILDKVDYSNGIIAKNKFVPFGKFFIDTNRLNDNIISIKRGKGINISGLPVQRVSNELGSVMRTIVGNGQPKYNEIEKLTDDEKKYLYKISKTTNILNKLSIPTPNKDDDEKDINQFEIYKGELLNGNDSSELIKKFKLLIVKMVKRDLLPKGQANEILMDMATLGY